VADIHDRLQRLSRRDELTRRVLQHRSVPTEVVEVGADFLDVVEAVSSVVRRHPGMSVMLAPGDGRRGSAVIRIAEQHGEAEVSVVSTPSSGADEAAPRRDPAPSGSAGRGAESPAPTPVPAGSGRADQRGRPPGPDEPPPPVWRPPSAWPPGATQDDFSGGQPDAWRWSG
jgi:hypothetical protein